MVVVVVMVMVVVVVSNQPLIQALTYSLTQEKSANIASLPSNDGQMIINTEWLVRGCVYVWCVGGYV